MNMNDWLIKHSFFKHREREIGGGGGTNEQDH